MYICIIILITFFLLNFYSPWKQYTHTPNNFCHLTSEESHHRPEINLKWHQRSESFLFLFI